MKVEFHLDKKQAPTTEKGMKVTYGHAKRGGYKLRWYLLLAIVLSPLLVMAYFFAKDAVLITAPGIVSVNPVTLTSPQEAVVAEITVKNGDSVKNQTLLVSLWDPVLAKDIESLQQQIVEMDETLRNRPDDSFTLYESAVSDAKSNLAEMERVLARYRKFSEQGQVSQIDMASAFQMYNAAQLSLASAEITLKKAKADALQERLAGPVAQARREMILNLDNMHAKMQQLSIESPYSGSVLNIFVQTGERVAAGAPVVMVSPNSEPKIIAYLSAKYIDSAQTGSKATVIFPNGERLDATVSEPTEIASKLPPQLAKPFEGSPALLRVTLTLNKEIPTQEWAEGMPVEVHF